LTDRAKWLLPRGALVRYREWYGASAPNVGLKMTAEAVGAGIAQRESRDPNLRYGVLDPACFREFARTYGDGSLKNNPAAGDWHLSCDTITPLRPTGPDGQLPEARTHSLSQEAKYTRGASIPRSYPCG
jgi:hypothetical protein